MNRLDGEQAGFKTAKERRDLVGKAIRYLRHCDIDRSGRGYFFPRFAVVEGAKGTALLLDNGDTVSRGDLVEIVIVGDAEGQP